MARLAVVALFVSGCTLIYGSPRDGSEPDLSADDAGASDDLGNEDGGLPPDFAGMTVVWSMQTSATLQNLRAIAGCSASNLFAPGTGGTLDRSTVANTWMPTLLGATELLAAATSTCSNIYIVGKLGTTYYSSDGTTFKLKVQGTNDLNGVWSNGVGAAAVGANGVAFYAAIGNNGWGSKMTGTTANLMAVWGSGTTFYAAGAGGTIVRSTNSGQNWSATTAGTATLRGGWASASGSDVYVVGDGGVILHSGDSGATWPASASMTTATLNAVWGSAPDDVYVVGAGGMILHSTDGGGSWSSETSNTSVSLNGVWGSSASDIYAVGDSGAILHRP